MKICPILKQAAVLKALPQPKLPGPAAGVLRTGEAESPCAIRKSRPVMTGEAAGADTGGGRERVVRLGGAGLVRQARRNAAGSPAARSAGSVWIMSITLISRITGFCGNF